jgi:hypothetical protein
VRWHQHEIRCTHGNVVGLLSIRRDGNEDADDAEEGVHQGPPGEVGEGLLDIADDGAYEGDQPSQLRGNQTVSRGTTTMGRNVRRGKLTMAMEIVARANGSPMMRPMLNLGPSL